MRVILHTSVVIDLTDFHLTLKSRGGFSFPFFEPDDLQK